ncbi:hypothetical protein ACFUC1_20195 [Pedococcus sp. NPDC057267]|uniref:hypothetical protein n=1 Tax=Pedococcus sp. NPDC057267 TaxID=3346077 RepID=UPI0036286390
MKIKHVAGVAALVAAMAAGLPAAAQAAPKGPELHKVGSVLTDAPVRTEAELNSYVASDAPKTAVQDPKTGKLTKVTTGATVTPMIATRNPCASTDLCLQPVSGPYAKYGF